MHGLMNNTKWRELLTLISGYPVYIQLKLVKDTDFHIDVERADWVISSIEKDHFTYVKRTLTYQQIDKLKIKIHPTPKELMDDTHQQLMTDVGRLMCNNIQHLQDCIIVNGYQSTEQISHNV